jgi:hypothetical protein
MSEAALTVVRGEFNQALTPIPSSTPLTTMAMLGHLVANGASIEAIKEVRALQKEIEADAARKEFNAALAAAKAEFPVITKNRHVSYESQDKKSRTEYSHEDLGEIARAVDPILGRHGLSYRFETTSEINQPIVVTCILGHRDGHSVTNTLMAGRDDSGKKNALQQMGSTITYLQRYTLKAALGLASSADDDGKTGGEDEANVLTDEQIERLQHLIHETETRIDEFLVAFGIGSLSDMPTPRFDEAVRKLEKKKTILANRRNQEAADA